MGNELIFDYILWKRVGILKAIETKKDFKYGVDKDTIKEFSKFIGKPITIATMKKLEMFVEEKENKPYLYDKNDDKLYDLEKWIENELNPRVIKFVENKYDEYVNSCVEKNMEYITKSDFSEETFRRMLEDEDIEVVDIYNIPFSYSDLLDFDKKEKIIRYKNEEVSNK